MTVLEILIILALMFVSFILGMAYSSHLRKKELAGRKEPGFGKVKGDREDEPDDDQ